LRAHWTAFSLDFKWIVTQWLGTANHGAIACLEFSTQAVSAFTETPDLTLLVHLSCQWVSALWCLFEIKIKKLNDNLTICQIWPFEGVCVPGYAKLNRFKKNK